MSSQNTTYGIHPFFKAKVQEESAPKSSIPDPLVSVSDRVSTAEATVLGFAAENSLPFTMVPKIVELSKQLSKDRAALDALSVDRTSASYKTNYGVAKTFMEELVEDLQSTHFSLNIDEATSQTNKRVVSVLVCYFNPRLEEIVVRHLASFSVIKVNSETLYDEIVDLFEKFKIPWENLLSILMDSCNVMRGSKSGLETRIRQNKAPHLLDADGDSCHHAHNSAKEFCAHFDNYLEQMATDLFTDFKWSADLCENLQWICQALDIKYTKPERYVSHRWLSIYDVTCDIIRMWDALLLFYYSFLPTSEKDTYKNVVDEIYQQYEIDNATRNGIKKLQKIMAVKNMTTDGKNRKKRIYQKLFFFREKTRIMMKIYGSVLPMLKKYVMLFQTSQPLIHKLNDKQQELLLDFLSCFIRPEVLKDITSASLVTLNLDDTSNHLPDKNVHLVSSITKGLPSDLANRLIGQLKEAYIKCGKKLQTKMPVNNRLLKCISAIDPMSIGHTITLQHLMRLPELVNNVFVDEDQITQYENEVRKIQRQAQLIPKEEIRADTFWANLRKGGDYPNLSKMALALLSCFHGPEVESSFSVMGTVLDKTKGQMYVSTFSSVQTIKYHLKSEKKTACSYFKRKDHLHDPVNLRLCKNMKHAYKEYQQEKDREKEAMEKRRKHVGISRPSACAPTSKIQSKKKLLEAATKLKEKHNKKVLKRLVDKKSKRGK